MYTEHLSKCVNGYTKISPWKKKKKLLKAISFLACHNACTENKPTQMST